MKNIAVIFGGRSGEHKVSLTSAKNIIAGINRKKYNLTLIGIDTSGIWHLLDEENFLINDKSIQNIEIKKTNISVVFSPSNDGNNLLVINEDKIERKKIDIALPILHGTFGEDGTIQGLLEMAMVPYIGSDVLGSSVGMDKDVMKRLLKEAGIPIPKYHTYYKKDFLNETILFKEITQKLKLPLFIKPANLGSSVGIRKVNDKNSFIEGLNEAFKYDTKIIIEEGIEGREIECAVLGNETVEVSVPGEIIPTGDFYSFEAKYINKNGAKLDAPANLSSSQISEVQQLSQKAYRTLCAKGLARLDFFLTKDGKFLCNEINTFPGFTEISMFPTLWNLSGVCYSDLLEKLINLALERDKTKKSLLFKPE